MTIPLILTQFSRLERDFLIQITNLGKLIKLKLKANFIPYYLFILVLAIIIDYSAGILIENSTNKKHKNTHHERYFKIYFVEFSSYKS